MRHGVRARTAVFTAILAGGSALADSPAYLKYYDMDGDGRISLAEFEQGEVGFRPYLFYYADRDQDGFLNARELARAMRRARIGDGAVFLD